MLHFAAQLLEAMSASMAHSMDASICVAAKELKEQRSSSKISKDGDQSSQPFTVEMIQQYLENCKDVGVLFWLFVFHV